MFIFVKEHYSARKKGIFCVILKFTIFLVKKK